MKKLSVCLVVSMLSFSAFADNSTLVERELKRAVVTHCRSTVTTPTVVFLPDGTEVPAVSGDPLPAKTDCVVSDSKINGVFLSGSVLIWSDDNGVITEMLFDADVVSNGNQRYRVSEWGETSHHQGNGAQYTLESKLAQDRNGAPSVFTVAFVRRTPDFCMESTSGEVADCPDRTTLMQVNVAPGITALLDYRPECPAQAR